VLLRHVPLTDPRVRPLLDGLAEEYLRRYGPNDVLADADAAEFDPPDGTFVVLTDEDGSTVAGGGLRRLDEQTAEVKRMWTARTHRRRGLAGQVLGELEATARARGCTRLVLETGPAQPEAFSLSRDRGYLPIAVYGGHEDALAFERPLTEQAPTERPLTEQAPTERPLTEQAPTERPLTEQTLTEQTLTEQAPTERSLTEQTLTKQTLTRT
jgi:GNAT superfamily N-acetyltransferase